MDLNTDFIEPDARTVILVWHAGVVLPDPSDTGIMQTVITIASEE